MKISKRKKKFIVFYVTLYVEFSMWVESGNFIPEIIDGKINFTPQYEKKTIQKELSYNCKNQAHLNRVIQICKDFASKRQLKKIRIFKETNVDAENYFKMMFH